MSNAPTTAPLRTEQPGIGSLLLRPLNLAQDAATLHNWVNRPYARFWGLIGKSLEEVTAIYREQTELHGITVHMACKSPGGEPLFLLESYDPAKSELARHYPVQPGDCGFHLMLAPADQPSPGGGYQLMAAAFTSLFNQASVQRVVGEPDLRNQKMITRMLQLGFQPLRVIHLPNKTALLMALDRRRYEAGFAPLPPTRPVLRAWPLRVRWHFELGRLTRKLRAMRRQ